VSPWTFFGPGRGALGLPVCCKSDLLKLELKLKPETSFGAASRTSSSQTERQEGAPFTVAPGERATNGAQERKRCPSGRPNKWICTYMYQGTKPFSVALLIDSVQMEFV